MVPTPQERGCFISSQIYESLKKGFYCDMILNPERWETLLPIAFQKSVTVLVNASTGKKSLSQRGKFNKLIFCTDVGRVEWKNEGILQPPKAAKLSPSNTSVQNGERKSYSLWWVWMWKGLRQGQQSIGGLQYLALTPQEESPHIKNWTLFSPSRFFICKMFPWAGNQTEDYKCESR